MALTQEQQRLRDGKITASVAPALMAGDEAKILREWQRIVGDPAYEPEDLSASWPVAFGSYIESFALDWDQTRTGQPLSRRGEVVTHPEYDWLCCTLDAWREADRAVIDCKAIGMWRKLDDALPHYLPQMIVQRACLNADRAVLLVVHGGSEPAEHPCEWDAAYETIVWDRIRWFRACCETLTPPVAVAAVVAPVKAERIVDMRESNAWANHVATWLEYREAAKLFKTAEAEIKALVPPDAKRAHGAGIKCERNKAGNLSIREMAA